MLRFFLTCGLLLLALQCLQGRQQAHQPHLPTLPMAGLCSGDCVSCGCPPALAASGDCCCTRTRQLHHPTPPAIFAKDFVPTNLATPSWRCAPCNRSSALTPLPDDARPLLPASSLTLTVQHPVRTHFPEQPLCGVFRSTSPPHPPPEVLA